MDNPKEVTIQTSYITLGQFLKLANCIDSGGQAKVFLQDSEVLVNNEIEQRRGRKLVDQDTIYVEGFGTFKVIEAASQ